MREMTVEGTVENGQVKLPADVRLPEHVKVLVIIPGVDKQPALYIGSPRLAHPEQAADFETEVIEESPDGGL